MQVPFLESVKWARVKKGELELCETQREGPKTTQRFSVVIYIDEVK